MMKIISCLLLVLTLSIFQFCEPIALEDNFSRRGSSSSSSSTTNATNLNSYGKLVDKHSQWVMEFYNCFWVQLFGFEVPRSYLLCDSEYYIVIT